MHDDKNIHGKIRLEHVISFADAIFAFSITFMAISIQIPNLPIITSHKQSSLPNY
jgi:uncharacterized membrane protein